MENETRRLAEKGLKPTPNRILVLRELAASDHPLSLGELEIRLDTLDRSSIFRVLTLFLDHELVHSIEDGSGSLRYEACAAPGKCTFRTGMSISIASPATGRSVFRPLRFRPWNCRPISRPIR